MGRGMNLHDDSWDIKDYLSEAILSTTFSYYMEGLQ